MLGHRFVKINYEDDLICKIKINRKDLGKIYSIIFAAKKNELFYA